MEVGCVYILVLLFLPICLKGGEDIVDCALKCYWMEYLLSLLHTLCRTKLERVNAVGRRVRYTLFTIGGFVAVRFCFSYSWSVFRSAVHLIGGAVEVFLLFIFQTAQVL